MKCSGAGMARPVSWIVALCVGVAVLLVLPGDPEARADVFKLVSGGRIEGEPASASDLNEGDAAGAARVRISKHIAIVIDSKQVQAVEKEVDSLTEYRRRAPTVSNTAAAQWKLAEWCRERKLIEQRSWHLARTIALDPQHGPAHRGLGHSQVGGQWMHRDQRRRELGYEYYRGQWRLPQEIELLESNAKRELAEKEWRVRVKRWRTALDRPDGAEALAQLQAIRDPHAVPALADRLATDGSRSAKLAYLEALVGIGAQHEAAFPVIAECALRDDDEEVFHAAVDAVELLKPIQGSTYFIKELRAGDNRRLNRAGYVLGRLGDEQAIGPLIDKLVTAHTLVIPGRNGGATTASFGRGENGGPAGSLLESGAGPQVVHQQLANPLVLDSLVRLTGANLGYDMQAWRAWQSSHAPPSSQQ